jgi:hypothetical protein
VSKVPATNVCRVGGGIHKTFLLGTGLNGIKLRIAP